jgi:EamA domain-containing membrane protein RarD
MTARRLRIGAIAAVGLAIILFVTTVQVLQWIAVALAIASIPVLLWTLFNPPGRDA